MQRTWTGLVFIATSVDGYIATADGDLDWLTDPPVSPEHVPAHAGPDAPPDYEEFTSEVSHIVLGRGTYEKVQTFDPWPYARFRVLVLSTTLDPTGHDKVTVVPSLDAACEALAAEKATRVYLDGGQVITDLLAADLIDELTVSRAPVLLGNGIPLFRRLRHEIRLIHLGTSTTDTGMTTTHYRIAH